MHSAFINPVLRCQRTHTASRRLAWRHQAHLMLNTIPVLRRQAHRTYLRDAAPQAHQRCGKPCKPTLRGIGRVTVPIEFSVFDKLTLLSAERSDS
jgi:hypothetical protein